eukprot:1814646-Amphidinium_carterae.2
MVRNWLDCLVAFSCRNRSEDPRVVRALCLASQALLNSAKLEVLPSHTLGRAPNFPTFRWDGSFTYGLQAYRQGARAAGALR